MGIGEGPYKKPFVIPRDTPVTIGDLRRFKAKQKLVVLTMLDYEFLCIEADCWDITDLNNRVAESKPGDGVRQMEISEMFDEIEPAQVEVKS